jgi:C-terminal processing protease CtpA/Prc
MKTILFLAISATVALVTCSGASAQNQEQQQISALDRQRGVTMLTTIHDALRKNYYDPTFHGVDIDARYKTYKQRVEASRTLAESFRTIAAYLSGLDDSHTFFSPPQRSYRINSDYRLQVIGENCYVTEVRPGTDAVEKLHPGDQVLSLDGYALNRKDIWQLQYYLSQIAPEVTSRFKLRDSSGNVRETVVNAKYRQGHRLQDVSLLGSDFWHLVFAEEEQQHLLRNRYVEKGELMIWKLPIFETDDSEIDKMINLARKHKTLILDLRGNPGGYESTLTHTIGSFFDHDIKVGTRIERKEQKPLQAKSRGKNIFSGKLIVLVDSQSASAAEIFARVVQLEGRATVLGDRSSGSVMEAMFYPFKAGVDIEVWYGASITRGNLVMTDGKGLEKVGVVPDEVIVPTAADVDAHRDPVLSRAAELAGTQLDPVQAGKLFPFEWAPL